QTAPIARSVVAVALALAASGAGQARQLVTPEAPAALPTGSTAEEVYRAACATCHAPDGRGSARTVVGFDAPLPDFTDCRFATGEPDPDWFAVVHEGGPVRG